MARFEEDKTPKKGREGRLRSVASGNPVRGSVQTSWLDRICHRQMPAAEESMKEFRATSDPETKTHALTNGISSHCVV